MKRLNPIGLFVIISLVLLLSCAHVPSLEIAENRIQSVPHPNEMRMRWSTYLGGSAEDSIRSLDRDEEGNIAVLGYTQSSDFPVSDNAFQTTYGGSQDCFVALFDSAGEIKFVTFLGGTGPEYSSAVAFDSAGNLSVTGMTGSTDFPLQNPYQDTMEGDTDMFITKLNQSGDLLFSTYLGGDGSDWGYGLVYDSQDNLVLTGHIDSTDFPT
ncbi:MAG: SBBP repeat-containing protein, partial [Candidatus Thorarchaeota archaeon]